MAVGDILDGAFAVLKARPATVIKISVAFVLPIQVLLAWLQRDLLGGVGLTEMFRDPTLAESADSGGSTFAQILVLVLPSAVLPIVAGALVLLVSSWYAGRDRTAADVLGAALRCLPALVVSWLFIHVLEIVAGVFFILPGVLVMTVFVVTAPVIVAEGLGPIAGMRRSWRLVTPRLWPTMGVALLSGIVVYLLGQTLGLLPIVIGLVIGLDSGWWLVAAGGAITGLITTPVIAAANVLLYLDLRIRHEGLDLELGAAEQFTRA